MDLQVREAQYADTESIQALVMALAQERGTHSDSEVIASMVAECLGSADHTILVASSGDSLLGYVAVHWAPMPMLPGREGYVSDMVVGVDWRGMGVGGNLIRAVEREAASRGCVRLTLNNRTDRESYQRSFYPKAGFRERTEFANFVKPI